MKREAKLLLGKACDALVLSIELFNRPQDRGRVTATLIQLDHGFEMLMKAAILNRGGRIRDRRAKETTIGFDACVTRSLSDGDIKYLTEEQVLVLQTINGLRDAAQHHLLDISENQLYVHVQSGVTLFRSLLKSVFDQELASHVPTRVFPVSTSPPTDLATLFDTEVADIKKLLRPSRRRKTEAKARLRPLAILDGALRGKKGQPSDGELTQFGRDISSNKAWGDVFPGVAAVELKTDGAGLNLSLKITKKEGIPIQLVPEGTPAAAVVGVKRVSDQDYYSLGAKQLAERVGLTMPKVVAVIDHFGLRDNPEYYKEFKFGKSRHKRYSQKAIEAINVALTEQSLDDIWARQRELRT